MNIVLYIFGDGLYKLCLTIVYLFVSRVGLVSKCVDQGDVKLIWFDKEYLLLLLQAFVSIIFLLLSPASEASREIANLT